MFPRVVFLVCMCTVVNHVCMFMCYCNLIITSLLFFFDFFFFSFLTYLRVYYDIRIMYVREHVTIIAPEAEVTITLHVLLTSFSVRCDKSFTLKEKVSKLGINLNVKKIFISTNVPQRRFSGRCA